MLPVILISSSILGLLPFEHFKLFLKLATQRVGGNRNAETKLKLKTKKIGNSTTFYVFIFGQKVETEMMHKRDIKKKLYLLHQSQPSALEFLDLLHQSQPQVHQCYLSLQHYLEAY